MTRSRALTYGGTVAAVAALLGVTLLTVHEASGGGSGSGSGDKAVLQPALVSPTIDSYAPDPDASAAPSVAPSPTKAAVKASPVAAGSVPDPVITSTPDWAVAPPVSIRVTPIKRGGLQIYTAPGGHKHLTRLDDPLYEGVPLVLAQNGQEVDGWLPVVLPIRPNNQLGWVNATQVTTQPVTYSIDAYLSRHITLVWHGSQIVKAYTMASGAPATPTPQGTFYVLTTLPGGNGAYGPMITATSGFSEVYTTFGDGDAVTAFHGTDIDSSVGHAVSHGCMRMHNPDADWMGHNITPGTVVRVHA